MATRGCGSVTRTSVRLSSTSWAAAIRSVPRWVRVVSSRPARPFLAFLLAFACWMTDSSSSNGINRPIAAAGHGTIERPVEGHPDLERTRRPGHDRVGRRRRLDGPDRGGRHEYPKRRARRATRASSERCLSWSSHSRSDDGSRHKLATILPSRTHPTTSGESWFLIVKSRLGQEFSETDRARSWPESTMFFSKKSDVRDSASQPAQSIQAGSSPGPIESVSPRSNGSQGGTSGPANLCCGSPRMLGPRIPNPRPIRHATTVGRRPAGRPDHPPGRSRQRARRFHRRHRLRGTAGGSPAVTTRREPARGAALACGQSRPDRGTARAAPSSTCRRPSRDRGPW